MIKNPTPVTPQTFNGMWVSHVRLVLPNTDFPETFREGHGSFNAMLLPYDGTHLLATGGKPVFVENLLTKRAADSTFDGVIASIVTEVERQAGKTGLRSLIVIGNDPAKPVRAMAEFADLSRHTIADCFALAGTDQTFATVFQNTMGTIAMVAGLSIE
jgi:hypothetical protein